MNNPRISIIIPAYGQADSLLEAMDSALDQTIPCEVIVINDGSPDRTKEYAESYKSKGIKVINQVNKGLASARNTGIMNATGDYILPLDADDMLLPECAERIINKIKKTNADIIGLSFKIFGSSSGLTILKEDVSIEEMKIGNHLGYCSAIKKDALLEVGGYQPKMTKGWEDYHLWFDLIKRGKKVVTVQEPLWLYRTKEEGSMWKDSIKYGDELWAQIKKDHYEIFS